MFSTALRASARFFSSMPKKPIVTFTEDALERFRSSIKPDHVINVSLDSGGCAGLKLDIDYKKEKTTSDVDISQGYVEIVMDKQTAEMLEGATIDYKDTLLKSGFDITHPAIAGACGCNESVRYDFNWLKGPK